MSVCQLVLIVSQRNAGVETGFSVNGGILVENLKETSLVAQQQVCDAIICKAGVLNVEITNKMLLYVIQSNFNYQQCI